MSLAILVVVLIGIFAIGGLAFLVAGFVMVLRMLRVL